MQKGLLLQVLFLKSSKMAKHLEIGQLGESLALQLLERKGYEILETNWRFSRAEIDIVAMDGDILVFVEVKTRSYDYFGKPDAFITDHKRKLLLDAAAMYMQEIQHDWEIRFDVISVLLEENREPFLQHFEDAFFA